jgi:branched-chain amino acid transport system permease protein
MSRDKYAVTYREQVEIFGSDAAKIWLTVLYLVLLIFPFVADTYFIYLANLAAIFIIGALGLNLLTGNGGLISLGHAGFVAIGAYTSGILVTKLGFPFLLSLPISALVAGLFGMVVGLPALRLKGLYLAMITMGFVFVVEYLIDEFSFLTGGEEGLMAGPIQFGSTIVDTDFGLYFLIMPIMILLCYFTRNLLRSSFGRALMSIRDRDIAAEVTGVNLGKYKVQAFALSAVYAGIAGAIYGHYVQMISPDYFGILMSIEYIVIIIIGGLGSVLGTILGAIFVTLVPEGLRLFGDLTRTSLPVFAERFGDFKEGIFGLLMIFFIIFEPAGLSGIWRKIKIYWKSWPFRY